MYIKDVYKDVYKRCTNKDVFNAIGILPMNPTWVVREEIWN